MRNNIFKTILQILILGLKIIYFIFMVMYFINVFRFEIKEGKYIFLITDTIFDVYILFIILISFFISKTNINKALYRIGLMALLAYFIVSGVIANERDSITMDIAEWLTYILVFLPTFFINLNLCFERDKTRNSRRIEKKVLER